MEVDYKSEAETAAKSLTALERPECNQATDCTIARERVILFDDITRNSLSCAQSWAATVGTAGRRKSAPETAAEAQVFAMTKVCTCLPYFLTGEPRDTAETISVQADSRLKYIVGPKRRRIHEAEPASTVSSEGTSNPYGKPFSVQVPAGLIKVSPSPKKCRNSRENHS